jgi:Transglycosylase SLT domain
MTFDAGAIEATLTLDRDSFQRGLREAQAEEERFSQRRFSAKLDVDTGDADAKATTTEALYAQLRENLQRGMDVNVDTASADAHALTTEAIYANLRRNLQRNMDVDVDTTAAVAHAGVLAVVFGALRRLITRPMRVDVDTGGATAAAGGGGLIGWLRKLRGGADDFAGGILNARTQVGALAGLCVIAFPMISAAIIPLVGLIGGLGAGFVAAGASAVGFGALAIPLFSKLIKDHQALAKAQQQYNAATTNKQRQAALQAEKRATDNLTGSERGLFGMLQNIIGIWHRLQAEFARPIAHALTPTFAAFRDILALLPKLVRPVLPVIRDLGEYLDKVVKSPQFKAFIRNLGEFGAKSLYMFSMALLNVLRGLSGLVVAFEPIARVVLPGLVRLTDQFANWGQSVGKTKGFHDFIQFTIKNLPVLGALFTELLKLIVKLVVAFAPLGVIMLKATVAILHFLNSMNPDVLLLIVGGIGLIIGGFAGIAAAVVVAAALVVRHWGKISAMFDDFRHRTAVVFDGVRHEIAHVWDQIFQNSIGMAIRFTHNVETQWNSFQHSTANIFNGIRHEISHIWDMAWQAIWGWQIRGARWVIDHLGDWRHHIANIFNGIRHEVAHIWDVIWDWVFSRAKNAVSADLALLGDWRHHIANVFNGIRHEVAHIWDVVWDNTLGRLIRGTRDVLSKIGDFFDRIRSGFNRIRDDIGRIWGQAWEAVKQAVLKPVNWVIRYIIDDGLIKAFNWISSKVGGPHIPNVPTIGGGGGSAPHSGTQQQSGNRTGPGTPRFRRGGRVPGGYGGGDIVPVLAEPGEAFVDKHRARKYAALLAAMGVPGFQGGGIVDQLSNLLGFSGGGAGAGLGPEISGAINTLDIAQVAKIFKEIVEKGTGPAVGLLAKLLKAGVTKLSHEAVSFIGRLFKNLSGFGGGKGIFGYSGGARHWAPMVAKVLSMLGLPASYLGMWLSQIQSESGGNPLAINRTDINAQRGDPSRGLLQTIMSTFLAYAGRYAQRGIYDPFANIYAAINYALHRYGRAGMVGVIGHGHGYDKGGPVPPGATTLLNRTGRTEEVLTPDERAAFVELAKLASSGGGLGGPGMDRLARAVDQIAPRVAAGIARAMSGPGHLAVQNALLGARR